MSLVPELTRSSDDRVNWTVEVVRSKATCRTTVRYTFERIAVIYGKLYFDRSLGRATYSTLAHLWKQGFAAGSGLEVPEPLGFLEEASLLLLRRAADTPLNELAVVGTLQEALTAVRIAARWLAKYHATEIPGLPVQSPCERIEILSIADARAKVAAEYPQYSPLLIGMLHDLHGALSTHKSSSRLVATHGQFRPAHVFSDGKRATVIDIEKICLSDPAKDVARFVHSLKKICIGEGHNPERGDELSREFVAEYRMLSPSGLGNLAYFRALLAFKAFAKLLKSHKVDEDERQALGEMYRLEFERTTHGNAFQGVAA